MLCPKKLEIQQMYESDNFRKKKFEFLKPHSDSDV
jgi:hypothetical protein